MKVRTIAGLSIVVLLVVWLGFAVHRAPRFAGSPLGVAVGIAAAVLMVLPLLYTPFRRSARLRRRFSRRLPLARMLDVHVVSGLAGATLAIIHSGHRFEHPVGITLVTLVLLVSLSGFVGYDLLRRLAARKAELAALQPRLRTQLARDPRGAPALAAAIADIELASNTGGRVERALRLWRIVHVVVAVLLFGALGVHVWSALYFGVRS